MKIAAVAIATVLVIAGVIYLCMGDGGLKRAMTLSGVYAVCKPGGYEAVCFLDSDSKEGGLSCLPLSQVGGKCGGI